GRLTLDDAILLMIGRHFRINGVKVIVGRNMEENNKLLAIAEKSAKPYLLVSDYKGPITLIAGEPKPEVMEKAAAITVRYSDAPRNVPISVIYRHREEKREMTVVAAEDKEIERLRV
ncbi:MAG: hypothetical protein QW619_05600, partial [Candidatus Bathyarchaeia archaeon]